MSTSGGVEAFLAAKWKSKKIYMEDELDEQEELSSNPQTHPVSPKTYQNAHTKKFENFSAQQKFRPSQNKITIIANDHENSFTQKMMVSEEEASISAAKSDNLPKESFINSGSSGLDKDTSGVVHAQSSDVDEMSDDPEEEYNSIMQSKHINRDKKDKYEMTGDVWGLFELQNEDDEQDEASDFSAQALEGGKHAPPDMVFGALSSEDVNKMSNPANSKRVQVPTASALGVPTMALPFSNFGKLLEQRENRLTGDALIPKKLYVQGLLNNTVQHIPHNTSHAASTDIMSSNVVLNSSHKGKHYTESTDKVTERDMLEQQRFYTKLTPASRKMATASDTSQLPRFKIEELEPDSTTTFRQNPSNTAAGQYPQTNLEQGTQKAIIETNLNQKLLPPRAPYRHQARSEFRTPMALESTSASTYNGPALGSVGAPRNPSSTSVDPKKDMLPISRFRTNVDPLAKTITYNVVKYFQNRKHLFDVKANEVSMASEATGMVKSMITKILTEANENAQQNIKPFFSECKSRKMPKKKFLEPNVKRDCIARMFIHNSYLIQKEVPTLKKMIKNCQENGFEKVLGTTAACVRAHLKTIGFEYNARSGKKKFLIERPDFIAQRIRYLEETRHYRAQQRNIVFVFITDMLEKGIKSVEWEGWDGVFQDTEQGIDMGCISVLHAASANFVFHDCLQIIQYEVNSHLGLPRQPFIEWLTTRLLPQVPKGSVIVLGDQRFHQMVDIEKRPHVGCTKEQINGWLRLHNVLSDDSCPEALLLEKVQKVVLDQKYVIDDEITALGYIPIHMPLHHRDLNPLSFIWQDIKDKLDNTPDISNLRLLRHFVKDEFTKAATKLGKAWIQVEKLEKSYYNIDMHTDDGKEELILRYGDGLVPIDNEMEIHSSDDEEQSDNEGPSNKMKKNE